MSFNLANLSPREKNRIELDKQASFWVWKLKQAKTSQEEISKQIRALRSDDDKTCFQQSVDKYKRVMAVK
jgi:hypothetical protein